MRMIFACLLALTLCLSAFAGGPSLKTLQDSLASVQSQVQVSADICADQIAAGPQSQEQIDQCAANVANGKVRVDQINAMITAKLAPPPSPRPSSHPAIKAKK